MLKIYTIILICKMKAILKENIPKYIINSKLVEQFEDEIPVPDDYIPDNQISIIDETSFKKIMNILRFFMVEKLPKEIYDYVLTHKYVNIDDFKDFFHDELNVLKTVVKHRLFINAASIGSVNLLEYLDKNLMIKEGEWCGNEVCKQTNRICERYCLFAYGHAMKEASTCGPKNSKKYIECIKYLHANGYGWPENDMANASISFYGYMTSGAASHGHLDRLKFLHENGCSWNCRTCECAAGAGNLDCLKYARKNGCEWSNYECICAIKCDVFNWDNHKDIPGSLECLKYVIDNGSKYDLYTGNDALLMWCVICNRIDCLEYLHNRFVKDIKKVIKNDHTTYTEWGFSPWYNNLIGHAAENASYECLKFLFENNYPCDKSVFEKIARVNNDSEDKRRRIKQCLECIRDNVIPVKEWNESTMVIAASSGNFTQIQYLYNNDAPCPKNIIDHAAKSGIECVKYFEEKGFKKYATTNACANAAKNMDIECLKYLHENGYQWDEETIFSIISYRHYFNKDNEEDQEKIIEFLEYPLKNNCPWGKGYGTIFDKDYDNIWHKLVSDKKMIVFKYLYEQIKTTNYTQKYNNNCFWTYDIINYCMRNAIEILHYMCKNQCICDAGIEHSGTPCGKIPWPMENIYEQLRFADTDTLKLIHTYGCPFDMQKMLKKIEEVDAFW